MIPKLNKKQKRGIVGVSGLILGFYMIFVLNNMGGFIPGLIGGIVLTWKKKW